MTELALAIAIGFLSAYAQRPTDATIEYRQGTGQLPHDMSHFDGVIAVADCTRIGDQAIMRTEGGLLRVIVFDCANRSLGSHIWMTENGIVAEVGWYLWQEYGLVGSRASVEYVEGKQWGK